MWKKPQHRRCASAAAAWAHLIPCIRQLAGASPNPSSRLPAWEAAAVTAQALPTQLGSLGAAARHRLAYLDMHAV